MDDKTTWHDLLLDNLQRSLAGRVGAEVVRIETHISTVLLAGDDAYKIKKPLDLGFLDYTTLDLRLQATGETEEMKVDLVIMALGNASNPIVKDAEPGLKTSKWGTIEVKSGSQETSIDDVYTGGDANRGGSTGRGGCRSTAPVREPPRPAARPRRTELARPLRIRPGSARRWRCASSIPEPSWPRKNGHCAAISSAVGGPGGARSRSICGR